ncbi:uncharacterized protein LOC130590205 [Beta vulgaris subsp. vulgaris]|uniref:uncharacterized protein LOC130590205 n=1 Tax=Beta vulgaris subsp. vulgaris TaxID=3555 RepID=UPI002546E9E5|nr:uncharacterized protein LOC130590205 [Beta vulgaris subsp. vulgaris]
MVGCETSVGTPTLSDPSDIPDYEEGNDVECVQADDEDILVEVPSGDDEEESSFESGDSEDDDDEDDGAPESPNLGSQTQRDDSQARDIGDHVPETPSSQREEAEGSNRASKRFDDNKETYNKKQDDCTTQGSQPNPDLLYWETVGGRNRGRGKGRCTDGRSGGKVRSTAGRVKSGPRPRNDAEMSNFGHLFSGCNTGPSPQRRPDDDPGSASGTGGTKTPTTV